MKNPTLAHAWGLTGGIAAGKSTAARLFEEAGIPVIDADEIARKLSAPGGAAHDAILERFGTTDRAKLRETVFADPQAKKALENLLHPLIQEESLRRIAAFGPRPVLYEAALLVETGRYQDFRGLIVVNSPREERKRRLMARDHCNEVLAEQLLSSQLPDLDREKVATHVLDNSGALEELRKKIHDLIPLL